MCQSVTYLLVVRCTRSLKLAVVIEALPNMTEDLLETERRIVSTADEVREATIKVASRAKRSITILTPDLEPGLYDLHSAVIVPHLGSATIGTRTKMGNMAAENCLAACRGERPPNLVNPEALDMEARDA